MKIASSDCKRVEMRGVFESVRSVASESKKAPNKKKQTLLDANNNGTPIQITLQKGISLIFFFLISLNFFYIYAYYIRWIKFVEYLVLSHTR